VENEAKAMKIIKGIDELHSEAPCAVTLGTFDGVHRGHRSIIEKLIAVARERQLQTTLLTFDPHPRQVLLGPDRVKLLTTTEEKLRLLQKFDLHCIAVLDFTRSFAEIPYRRFVREILLERLNMKALVIGYDHNFGKNGEGNYENLKKLSEEWGFELFQVKPFSDEGQVIKSSHIRELLLKGKVEEARHLLGHPYTLSGKVVKGRLLGKEIDFPTANLQVTHPAKLVPGDGVYAVDVEVNGRMYKGMMNIGYRPTLNHSTAKSIEVHIHDFNQDIYGEIITVVFKKRLRDEIKFPNLEALIEQLKKDREQSLKI
jgi:riboflavin kinase/FMN adenylyltransferase